MDMVWRRLLQPKVRLDLGRKLPFSADRYSFLPAGFNAKWGIVHPSVGRQRLSEGVRPKKDYLTEPRQKPGTELSEAEAIERAKQGDAEAFQVLYDKHKRRVYSLCLRMTANTAEAEDLAQEAFLQLYRKIATFRGESAFSTWLHRLSVNVVLMH